jgi:hypothetical protein
MMLKGQLVGQRIGAVALSVCLLPLPLAQAQTIERIPAGSACKSVETMP